MSDETPETIRRTWQERGAKLLESLPENALIATGGVCHPGFTMAGDGRMYDPTDRMRSLIPPFTAARGGIKFRLPTSLAETTGLDPEELEAWRQAQRVRRDRESAWMRRRDQHCLCRWATRSNGDPYEDEQYRVDHTTCPVHGFAERDVDDD